jgi:pyruvate-formate lyase
VYDDSYIRLRDFNRILETDYENMEDFRLMIKNRIPKYGNGVKEVDDLAHTVARWTTWPTQ